LVILIATGVIAFILIILGKDPLLILSIGVLTCFLIYALWNPPKKHKDFSLSDQQQATSRALGGSGSPDLPHLKPSERKSHREKRKTR
jgi:hypothetical protein